MENTLDKYKEKLPNYYDENQKLKVYPSKKPFKILVLYRIASVFELGRTYTEKEVNEIIRNQITFSDHELLRRELFQFHLLNRTKDGASYWLEETWENVLQIPFDR